MDYQARVCLALEELGVPRDMIARRALVLHPEAGELTVAEIGENGREFLLTPQAAAAWCAMKEAAGRDGIGLQIVSAFRSLERQTEIFRSKVERGVPLDEILSVNAPPGYSEHHTGCAVDIGTAGCSPLEEIFEETPAFRWLRDNAWRFGFRLSYERGNSSGYLYEPWHWCFHGHR